MTPASYTDIRSAIAEYLPNARWTVLDRTYVLLTEEAIDAILDGFADWLTEQGIDIYELEKGDCDDYAWLLRAYVIIRNWKQRLSGLPVAWLYGHYCLEGDISQPHAINFPVVRNQNGKVVLRSVEPQRRHGRIDLTAGERNTGSDLIG